MFNSMPTRDENMALSVTALFLNPRIACTILCNILGCDVVVLMMMGLLEVEVGFNFNTSSTHARYCDNGNREQPYEFNVDIDPVAKATFFDVPRQRLYLGSCKGQQVVIDRTTRYRKLSKEPAQSGAC